MKKLYFFICFISLLYLFPNLIYSQTYGWFSQSSGTTNNLNAIDMVNSTTGIVVGNGGTIIRTTNGGTNWFIQGSGSPNHLFGVYFINSTTGWASGDVGIILKTTNSGANWVIQYSNTIYQLHSISFINATTGSIAGWYGTIVRTTNGGAAWYTQNSGTVSNLRGLSFVNASTGYSVGWLGTILKTVNSGSNWYTVSSGTSIQLEDVIFTDAYTGFVIGETGRIQKTTNGGANWVTQSSGTANWLNGMTNPAPNMIIAAGESGTIRKTSNSGTAWITQTSNTSNWLNNITFPDTNNGFAIGDNGTIIKTTTGGWLLPQTPTLSSPANSATCVSVTVTLDWNDIIPPAPLYTVQVSPQSSFTTLVIDKDSLMTSSYAIPSGALAYIAQYYWRVKAKNQVGEGTWSSVRNFTTTFPPIAAPVLVSPANNSNGNSLTPILDWDSIPNAFTYKVKIAIDSFFNFPVDSSVVTVTTYTIPPGKLFNNVKYFWRVNGMSTCVTGAYSPIWNFKTLITGTQGINEQLPVEFKLYNNYPNPFNPITIIKFDIPSNIHGENINVRLVIYNVAGEEIAVPVSRQFNPGKYEINWDASNYPSGVYFYRIEAGSFIDIKKMVLIK